MNKKYSIFFLLNCSFLLTQGLFLCTRSHGQVNLLTENFGTGTAFPAGWTASPCCNTYSVIATGATGGYAGASLNSNVIIITTAASPSKTVTYDNSFSTVGYYDITVLWGARRQNTSAPTSNFSWSSDGVTYTPVTYTHTAGDGTWRLDNGGSRISLPSGADNIANLRLRWEYDGTTAAVGSFRFDDVTVEGCNTALTNYTFSSPSLSIAHDLTCASGARYTFTQTTDANCGGVIGSGVVCTVTFPAGINAAACSGGTFNGSAIASYTVTSATQIDFTTPVRVNKNTAFTLVLNNISNPVVAGNTGNISVSVPNRSGGVNSYTTYNATVSACPAPTNYTLTAADVFQKNALANCTPLATDYTFTQTLPASGACIAAGQTATVDLIAGTNATTMTSGTYNGVAINMGTVSTTSTQVTFTTPTVAVCCAPFTFTLNGITAPVTKSGTFTVTVANITGGNDIATYAYSAYDPFFASPFAYSSIPSYASALAAGVCYTNLVAGATYCFNFTFPSSGNIDLDWLINDPDGGGPCTSTSIYNILGTAATGCSQSGGGASTATYSNGCTFMNNFVSTGGGGACAMIGGGIYSICYTVPAACGGLNLCPLVLCSSGPCAGGVLPVQLLTFDAALDEKSVLLRWVTASEINNDFFQVERSRDGINYETIGKMQGAGTINSLNNYEFSDAELPAGMIGASVLYYRLRQVDYDGKAEFFGPVSVALSPPDQWNFSLHGTFIYEHLTGILYAPGASDFNIDVIDMQGKIVKHQKINASKGSTLLNIDAEVIEKGLYIISIDNGTSAIRKKFSKL